MVIGEIEKAEDERRIALAETVAADIAKRKAKEEADKIVALKVLNSKNPLVNGAYTVVTQSANPKPLWWSKLPDCKGKDAIAFHKLDSSGVSNSSTLVLWMLPCVGEDDGGGHVDTWWITVASKVGVKESEVESELIL